MIRWRLAPDHMLDGYLAMFVSPRRWKPSATPGRARDLARRRPLIVVAEPAEKDLSAGMDFYERQEEGAGIYFANHVKEAIRSLAIYHGIHMKRYEVFCLLIPKFPHAVFYREHQDLTEVIAIVDLRRDPKSIARQLRHR